MFKAVIFTILFIGTAVGDVSYYQPEQVHLSFGGKILHDHSN